MTASESTMVLAAVRDCTFQAAISGLEGLEWTVLTAVHMPEQTFVVTAYHQDRRARLYGKNGRVWSAKFCRRGEPTFTRQQCFS